MSPYAGLGRYVQNLVEHIIPLSPDGGISCWFDRTKNLSPLIRLSNRIPQIPLPRAPFGLHTDGLVYKRFFLNQVVESIPSPIIHWTSQNYLPHRFGNKKHIVTIHDILRLVLWQYYYPSRLAFESERRYLSHQLRGATKIIAISQQTKFDLVRLTGTPEAKIHVIYEAVDPVFYKIATSDHDADAQNTFGIDRPYFLFVGQIEWRKNVDTLLEAFLQLIESEGPRYQLVLVCANGESGFQKIRKKIAQKKAEKSVKAILCVDDEQLASLYRNALAFVFPSLYEGFGLPPLEAMLCKTAVIAARASCLPEILGENALYFDPRQPAELVQLMRKIADDSSIRTEFSARGFEWAKNFSWEKTARQTLDVYDEVLSASGTAV